MKLLELVCVVALIASVCGCATPEEWTQTRFAHEQIDAVKAEGKLPQLETVLYKSKQKGVGLPLAGPINGFAPVPAALYLKVVLGVDKAAICEVGRSAFTEYQELLKGNEAEGVKPMTRDRILAKWSKEDEEAKSSMSEQEKRLFKGKLAAVKEYRLYIENNDPDVLIPMIQKILEAVNKCLTHDLPVIEASLTPKAVAIANDAYANVTAVVAQGDLKRIMQAKDAASDAAEAGKVLSEDLNALRVQLQDTGVGAKNWLAIAQADRDAKKEMAAFDNISE